jgi:hypothetical protein
MLFYPKTHVPGIESVIDGILSKKERIGWIAKGYSLWELQPGTCWSMRRNKRCSISVAGCLSELYY